MQNTQVPTESNSCDPDNSTLFSHPAFGKISVNRWTCSDSSRLFGSDLSHRTGITIKLSMAQLERRYGCDRIKEGDTLVEFSMSESQWAAFVSGVGVYSGAPVTLNRYRSEGVVNAPAIAAPTLSKKEIHSAEIEAGAREALANLQLEIDRLGEVIKSGKIGKTDLKEIHRNMEIVAGNVPRNMGHAMETFARASEKMVQEAGIEIEARVNAMAVRLGIERMQLMAPSMAAVEASKD